jgi:Phosphotransferase enzyme family
VRVLERTLAHDFTMASNLPSGRDGARWPFLLPSLDIGDVRVLGLPPPGALDALARIASGTIVVATRKASEAAGLRRQLGSLGLDSRVVVLGEHGDPRASGPMTLTWTPGPLRGPLPAAPAGGGLHFVEFETPASSTALERSGPARMFVLRPPVGEVRLAAPLERSGLLSYFEAKTVRRGPRTWIALGRRRRPAVRVGALLGAVGDGPPDYLVEAARRHDLDVSSRPWAVRIGGDFASQKVVFVLGSANEDEAPELVVKITLWPELNDRLEAEYDALVRLREVPGIDTTRAPRPIFLDHHAGRAMVAESHLGGAPFPRPRRGTGENAALDDALDWLRSLAVATRRDVPPAAVADALDALLDRFASTYRPSAELARFLRRQVEAIRAAADAFPAVMMHGDCGAWNLRVAADSRVLFLDWEAADPLGLPLWDAFHLLRSVAVLAPRGIVPRRRIERIRRHLVENGPIGERFAAATRAQAEAVGLETRLIEPLFHLCWMHRALKEATRLPPSGLERGHYVRLLQMFVANRDGPVLRRAFGST